jgi:hypothetical protein
LIEHRLQLDRTKHSSYQSDSSTNSSRPSSPFNSRSGRDSGNSELTEIVPAVANSNFSSLNSYPANNTEQQVAKRWSGNLTDLLKEDPNLLQNQSPSISEQTRRSGHFSAPTVSLFTYLFTYLITHVIYVLGCDCN